MKEIIIRKENGKPDQVEVKVKPKAAHSTIYKPKRTKSKQFSTNT